MNFSSLIQLFSQYRFTRSLFPSDKVDPRLEPKAQLRSSKKRRLLQRDLSINLIPLPIGWRLIKRIVYPIRLLLNQLVLFQRR
jgi:hypothetical protein